MRPAPPTSSSSTVLASEPRISLLGGLLALALRPGDLVTLTGDLGAGKSTLARAIIRSFLDDPAAEVPSPTFSLMQVYEAPRFPIAHLDLYRLSDAADVRELGLDEWLPRGAALVEWPERGTGALGPAALDIRLAETDDSDVRRISLQPSPSFAGRLSRVFEQLDFLDRVQPSRTEPLRVRYLQGDASPRTYARVVAGDTSRVLMDSPRRPDGPPVRDGLPYSRIAHLAEDVRPFVAMAEALTASGLSAPRIFGQDLDRGLLLIEDFGDGVFGAELARGARQAELWRAATEVLVALRRFDVLRPVPLADGSRHRIAPFDVRALTAEIELLPDWLWPLVKGRPIDDVARAEFASAWAPLLTAVASEQPSLVLRDYHSPNLMWLPDRSGVGRVGLLDFQDAVAGHAAYDLVSLLQDARLDVAAELEAALHAHYVSLVRAQEPDFDAEGFARAYAVLGAQRNTKILGIFARLAERDGKRHYLGHIPRIWGYLARSLAHPALAAVSAWYDRYWPEDLRKGA